MVAIMLCSSPEPLYTQGLMKKYIALVLKLEYHQSTSAMIYLKIKFCDNITYTKIVLRTCPQS